VPIGDSAGKTKVVVQFFRASFDGRFFHSFSGGDFCSSQRRGTRRARDALATSALAGRAFVKVLPDVFRRKEWHMDSYGNSMIVLMEIA